MQILEDTRIERAKRAFSTRRVPAEVMRTLVSHDRPAAGALVLAQVTAIGAHAKLESPQGRRVTLAVGDEILVTYGNRYAPDQFEAVVPDNLGPCDLVAAGGIASSMLHRHDKIGTPTQIKPLGLVGDRFGRPITLADHALPAQLPVSSGSCPIIAVFGTSMNAGKTTTAAHMVRGFTLDGKRVGAAKITGTGAGGDLWYMRDYGAIDALDFTDVGMATTAREPIARILDGARRMVATLLAQNADVIILEVADGLGQAETKALMESQGFRSMLSGTVFAASDGLGAVAGADKLAHAGHSVVAISGALTQSPLAMREAQAATQVPVISCAALADPQTARGLMLDAAARAGVALVGAAQ